MNLVIITFRIYINAIFIVLINIIKINFIIICCSEKNPNRIRKNCIIRKQIIFCANFPKINSTLCIVKTGILMRYMGSFTQYACNIDWFTVPIVQVKALGIGLITGNPLVPEEIGTIFFVHLFLVCVLLAYFPFSKLMHMGGVFLSPTRVLANNNRAVRHVNPWDYPVKTHTYEEYEDEFREKMIEAGLPVDKMPETEAETEEAEKE